ncbi:MAG TPA: endopeptidase La [Acidimicrobiia bacterium]|nr:endopeptidase La [Acidimicrobiia bacterium]
MPETETLTLPVLPLANGAVLPQMVVTIALETDEARAAAQAARDGDGRLVLVPKADGRYSRIGTVARVENAGELGNGLQALVVRGLARARVGSGSPGASGALHVTIEPIDEGTPNARTRELAREYRAIVEELLEQRGLRRLVGMIQGVDEPGALADSATYWPDLTQEQRIELLETVDVEARLELVIGWAREALADTELREKIRSEVAEGLEGQQREVLLRRQLDAIRKELGEDDADEVAQYRTRVAEANLPETVRTAVDRELDRLERMGAQNPEFGWIRTWLDTMLDLPWDTRAEEQTDLGEARRVLDEDHEGLDSVKDRIVEFLAVRGLRRARDLGAVGGRGSGAILALVGPPGVGKTSLGESVARALGRPFVRVAVGGVRDEAEIRGHRRTYVGARPGRIVRALTEAGAMNPVVLIDEIDKVGSDWRGDPSSALLEVLDPAQNHTFRDHYLELELDLSDVLFLATANVLDTIPDALLDRMEVVRLDGYTEDEKVAIARNHLLQRQLSRAALDGSEVEVDDDALRLIASEHTREAGVRQLERAIARVLRKAATRIASAPESVPVQVTASTLAEFLGRPRFTPESAERTAVPGVATGLAVTGAGGDVLFIEATAMAGETGLTLTGQLGDVMKESAHIALSYLRSHGSEVGIDASAFDRAIHLHVPAGAVPKDGPSAGVTMVTALASLVTGRPVRDDVGMTGEVTLNGRVLPIGGVKQKLLAAHRAGLKTIFLPQRNGPDLDDVPAAVLADLDVRLVADVADIVREALEASDSASASGSDSVEAVVAA